MFATDRSRYHPHVNGIACDVHGDEAMAAQPIHEAACERGYCLFLRVGLSLSSLLVVYPPHFAFTFHLVLFPNCLVCKRVIDDLSLNKNFYLLSGERGKLGKSGCTFLATHNRRGRYHNRDSDHTQVYPEHPRNA